MPLGVETGSQNGDAPSLWNLVGQDSQDEQDFGVPSGAFHPVTLVNPVHYIDSVVSIKASTVSRMPTTPPSERHDRLRL